jgi:molecular chaperone GrpE
MTKKQTNDDQNITKDDSSDEPIARDDVYDYTKKKAELEQLQHELAEVKVEHEDLRNQLKRAIADYQNLERRVNEGRSELTQWANKELLTKLLTVLDHLEQALTGMSEEERKSGWAKGVEMSVKQFQDLLRLEGLEEIRADGQFDPTLHEAVDLRDGDDNMILEVVRKGYNLNGKVLRPAAVVVGRKEK